MLLLGDPGEEGEDAEEHGVCYAEPDLAEKGPQPGGGAGLLAIRQLRQ
jgi:hypothetical protein